MTLAIVDTQAETRYGFSSLRDQSVASELAIYGGWRAYVLRRVDENTVSIQPWSEA